MQVKLKLREQNNFKYSGAWHWLLAKESAIHQGDEFIPSDTIQREYGDFLQIARITAHMGAFLFSHKRQMQLAVGLLVLALVQLTLVARTFDIIWKCTCPGGAPTLAEYEYIPAGTNFISQRFVISIKESCGRGKPICIESASVEQYGSSYVFPFLL